MTGDKRTFTLAQLEAEGMTEPAIGRLITTKDGIIYRIIAEQAGWLAKEVLNEAEAKREIADREKARKLFNELLDLAAPKQVAELITEVSGKVEALKRAKTPPEDPKLCETRAQLRRGRVSRSPKNVHYARLWKRMQDQGHTPATLAQTIGVKQPTISQVLTGARESPRLRTKIAQALGTRVDRLFDTSTPTGETR